MTNILMSQSAAHRLNRQGSLVTFQNHLTGNLGVLGYSAHKEERLVSCDRLTVYSNTPVSSLQAPTRLDCNKSWRGAFGLGEHIQLHIFTRDVRLHTVETAAIAEVLCCFPRHHLLVGDWPFFTIEAAGKIYNHVESTWVNLVWLLRNGPGHHNP